MTTSFTYCTSGAIVNKAGAGVSSTAATSGGLLAQFSQDAMGFINGMTRYDWVANSGAITANFKFTLAEAEADFAAINLISYDMSGYMTSQAEDLINILYDRGMNLIKVLIDDKNKTKMGATNQ